MRITTYEGPLGDIYLIVVCNIEHALCSDMAYTPPPKASALRDMRHLISVVTGWLPREKEPISGILYQVWDGLPIGHYINAMGSTSDSRQSQRVDCGTIAGRRVARSLRFDQQTGSLLPRRRPPLLTLSMLVSFGYLFLFHWWNASHNLNMEKAKFAAHRNPKEILCNTMHSIQGTS